MVTCRCWGWGWGLQRCSSGFALSLLITPGVLSGGPKSGGLHAWPPCSSGTALAVPVCFCLHRAVQHTLF